MQYQKASLLRSNQKNERIWGAHDILSKITIYFLHLVLHLILKSIQLCINKECKLINHTLALEQDNFHKIALSLTWHLLHFQTTFQERQLLQLLQQDRVPSSSFMLGQSDIYGNLHKIIYRNNKTHSSHHFNNSFDCKYHILYPSSS